MTDIQRSPEKDSRSPKALATKLFSTILDMTVSRVTFPEHFRTDPLLQPESPKNVKS